MNRSRYLRWSLLALLLGAIAAVWVSFGGPSIEPERIGEFVSSLGVWAPILFVLVYAAGTLLFLPGSAFALLAGALFGPLWGTLLNLAGATLGATGAFILARTIASDWVRRRTGPRLERFIQGVEAEGWRFVAFVRLVPLFPFNLTNYALGLTRIRLLQYMLTSLVCMAPGALAYTWLGHAGRSAAEGNSAAINYGLTALGLLAAIAFLPRLVTRLRKSGWIEIRELTDRLAQGQVTIIDVREPGEFTGPLGHIAQAVNLPLGTLSERMTEIK
ncbi:MAG: VTT domain-containing protein, partial [Alphaproteobacteria bacterium]